MAIWGDIINAALGEINAITPGSASNVNDVALALTYAQALTDQWNALGLMQYVKRLDSYPFTAVHTDGAYTIGPGGDLPGERPVDILEADIGIVSGGSATIWYPMVILDVDQYEDIPIVEIGTTIPNALWYEPAFPLGIVHLWTYPTQIGYLLRLQTSKQLSIPPNIGTTFLFPPGYESAFRDNLAKSLLNPFGKTGEIAARVTENARNSMAIVMSVNAQVPTLGFDYSAQHSYGAGRLYNYKIGPLS